MSRFRVAIAVAAAASLAAPALAAAHVTVNPREMAAGSYGVLNVRVPNERDDKGTRKLDLRLPSGVYSLSYKKVPGWKAKVTRKKLAKPVDLNGFKVDRQVTRVVWTATSKRAVIAPGQFEEFPISVRAPDGDPGSTVLFKAFQHYEGGEVVRWAKASADADLPAPRLTLSAPAAH
jgi:uncharacterized protein